MAQSIFRILAVKENSIERDGSGHSVQMDDGAIPEALAALIKRLETASRARPASPWFQGDLAISYVVRRRDTEWFVSIAAPCSQDKLFPPGGQYDILAIHTARIKLKTRDLNEVQALGSRALIGNEIAVQIETETEEVILGVNWILEGFEIASDDLSQTPLVSFHRTCIQVEEACSGQSHKVLMEVISKSGEANKYASRIWTDLT
jgi:hypothetical protein